MLIVYSGLSKSEEGWRIQGIGRLLVAAAAPPMNQPAAVEDVVFWVGEHEGRRVGSAGRGAGDDRCAKGLRVVISRRVEWFPVLSVQGAGQVHVGHRASSLEVCFGQELQRLFKGGLQVGDPHRGVEAVGGGRVGKQRGTGRGRDWLVRRRHS